MASIRVCRSLSRKAGHVDTRLFQGLLSDSLPFPYARNADDRR
jgi:hypothetical protein